MFGIKGATAICKQVKIKMLRHVLILSVVATICLALSPLYQTSNYKVIQLKDSSSIRSIRQHKEAKDVTRKGSRSFVEVPFNGSAPSDDGSPLFGDIEFTTTNKDAELLIRDTIVNQNNQEDILILYNRSVPNYYVEDFRIFNVGRQRGFGYYAGIYHTVGFVEAELTVAANSTVRIFAELYGYPLETNNKS